MTNPSRPAPVRTAQISGLLLLTGIAIFCFCSCLPANETPSTSEEEKSMTDPTDSPPAAGNTEATASSPQTSIATFGGGCFWCVEAVMERLEGVTDVKSGYMGGHVDNPTYEEVCKKTTGHVEVVQITFQPELISFEELLDVFWQAHDPTTRDRQGHDAGPQYRSVVFFHSPEQKDAAEKSKAALDSSGKYENPVVTDIVKASQLWEAEEYHQDFYRNNTTYGYCRVVIHPKLKKLGLLKKDES